MQKAQTQSFHRSRIDTALKTTKLALIASSCLKLKINKINMGGTKRMSAEEKRKVILDIYHESKDVYTEKEIIVLATKAGVNVNT